MKPIPFKSSAASGVATFLPWSGPARDASGPTAAPPEAAERARHREILPRLRLGELDPHMHCSVIGTCVGTDELRKTVARFRGADFLRGSDLEVHHAAVEMATEGGASAKALGKLLDARHATAIERFRRAKDPEALEALWREAARAGEIPGAYWALLTHPHASTDLRHRVFGEVHMLSHLVGAANRADIRRLIALEEENGALRDKVERQQLLLREINVERRETVRKLSEQIVELTAEMGRQSKSGTDTLSSELAMLRLALSAKEQELALHTSRRDAAEQKSAALADQVRHLQCQRDSGLILIQTLQVELAAMERQLPGDDGAKDPGPEFDACRGKRLLYVGGRPSSNTSIRALCKRAGIELAIHDGGIEDRKGLLESAVGAADIVLFPVDCVDHDSMDRLKRLCQRQGIAYVPLRTAGLSSFLSALTQITDSNAKIARGGVARSCLRHG